MRRRPAGLAADAVQQGTLCGKCDSTILSTLCCLFCIACNCMALVIDIAKDCLRVRSCAID